VKKITIVTSENPQVQAIIDMASVVAKRAAKIQGEKLTTAGRQRVLAQGGKFTSELTAFVVAKMIELAEQVVGYLKLISGTETITIGETDGTNTIARASDVFTGWVDPDFVKYGKNIQGQPTKEMKVQVFEMIKNGTFAQIFGGFGENLDRLCLAQSQIICFVRDHSKWLHKDGYGTFFLFKERSEFFVSRVYQNMGRLEVDKRCLSDNYIWKAGTRRRIVVPQL
jgi:hypothetical protein